MNNLNINEILRNLKKGTIVIEVASGIFQATSASSQYIIEYDKNRCIGASSCAAIAPLTFFMNEDNKADFTFKTINNGEEQISELEKIEQDDRIKLSPENEFDKDDVILEGAQSCPVFAIKIIEKSTGQIIFPLDLE